ncbi:MAG: hypothetical protein Q4D31_04350 [Eubacteriales bacterium]|nr:hypothetical protein [Eubacteriales bacterium]
MKKGDLAALRPFWERAQPFVQRYRAVLIVLLAGVLLLASGGGADGGAAQPTGQTVPADGAGFVLADFERDLHDRLAAIDGVGRVALMLSLDQTEEAVYAVDTRQTRSGDDSRSDERDLALVSDGSYGQRPITVKRLLPTFRGAVVLCDGADDVQVRLAVTQAVGTVCGIGADKVTVLKMAAAA